MDRETGFETTKSSKGPQYTRRRTKSSPSLGRSTCSMLQNEKRRNSTTNKQKVSSSSPSSSKIFGATRDAFSKFTKKYSSNKRKAAAHRKYNNDVKFHTIDYDGGYINQDIPIILIDEAHDIILTDDIGYAMYVEQVNDAWQILAATINTTDIQSIFYENRQPQIEDYYIQAPIVEENEEIQHEMEEASAPNEIENTTTPISIGLASTAKLRIANTVDAISTFRTMATKRGDYFVQTLKDYFGTDST